MKLLPALGRAGVRWDGSRCQEVLLGWGGGHRTQGEVAPSPGTGRSEATRARPERQKHIE